MKSHWVLCSFSLIAGVLCLYAEPEDSYKISFSNAPLEIVLSDYSEKSGNRVEIVKGVYAKLSFAAEQKINLGEYQELMRNKLREKNVALFEIEKDRFVATWIDPSIATEYESLNRLFFTEHLRRRREETVQRKAQSNTNKPSVLSEEEQMRRRNEVRENLYEHQFELIKAGEPPLPLPMTPELKKKLEDEGIPIPDRFKE